jgi:adenylate cyclase
MAKEIERKFLVVDTSYREMSSISIDIRQGYLSADPAATVRVRKFGDAAFLTIKGKNNGVVRDEWEYPIPLDDACELLDRMCSGEIIHKVRHIVPYGGDTWEVDEFLFPCPGLTVAEIELDNPDSQFSTPPFIGREVTGDPAYYNSSIAGKANH